MADLRRRSQRSPRQGMYYPAGSQQRAATSNGRSRRPSPSQRHRQGSHRSKYIPTQNHSSPQISNQYPYNSGQIRDIVPNPPGAIVKTSSQYQSRDGYRMRFGPDRSRYRPQIGAHAAAFNGGRSPNNLHYSHSAPQNGLTYSQYSPQSELSFPGTATGPSRPVQRINPRPVNKAGNSKLTRQPRSVPSIRKNEKTVSPPVYVFRLLIVGIGIGAIAGTTVSFLDPTRYEPRINQPNSASSTPNSDREDIASINSLPAALIPSNASERSLMAPLQLGQEMTDLASELESIIGEYSGLNPGIFLFDLDTSNFLSVNGDLPFSAASTIKVPILVAFFQDVEAGRIKLDDVLKIKENDVATGSGDMQYEAVGTEYTALETATKMIIISDNTATNMLVRKLGGANDLNRRFQSWGLTSTAIRNPLPDLEGTNTTSPKDMVTLMTLVSNGELISLRSRDQMLHIMERTQTNTLLPQGIGTGAQIAHKTGDIGSMVGDVGLVDMPNGKRYAITALVQRSHNDPSAQDLIRKISNAVYDRLEFFQNGQDTLSTEPSTQNSPAFEPEGSSTPSVNNNPEFFGN